MVCRQKPRALGVHARFSAYEPGLAQTDKVQVVILLTLLTLIIVRYVADATDPIPGRFVAIVQQLRDGKQPRRATVRNLLKSFGIERRGAKIAAEIAEC